VGLDDRPSTRLNWLSDSTMSLATRCTSCGTVFRVVQDQLKVSEGWVRCGRCTEIFNALEGLFDLERDAPPDWSPLSAHETAEAVPEVTSSSPSATREPVNSPHLLKESVAIHQSASAAIESDWNRADEGDVASASHSSVPVDAAVHGTLEGTHSDPDVEPAAEPAPNFLRAGSRRSRGHGSAAGVMTAIVCAVLLVGLLGQIAFHFRDILSGRLPALRPWLISACDVLGCSIGPVHRIEDVAVESTALTRAVGPDSFRLAVALRNRGTMMLAMPWLELSLTDSGGHLVARRALMPSDFPGAATTLLPGAESALQLTLATGNAHITGYTVEVFYP
jgi:predicted Zn finger-like uncharacterized protein